MYDKYLELGELLDDVWARIDVFDPMYRQSSAFGYYMEILQRREYAWKEATKLG